MKSKLISEYNQGMNRESKISLKRLNEQVIVITGASSGIGLVTARMAVEQGAKVVVAARNEDALKKLVDELRDKGHEAIWVQADVGVEEDVNRIAETAIEKFGRFDTWVNNAGITIFGKATEVSIDDMKRMFDTNYWGVVYGSKVAVKHFKERGIPGALINVGSIFGNAGAPIESTYSPSKFAVHGWTDSLRIELAAEKAPVSVTLIQPGRIDTPYNEHAGNYLNKQPAHDGMIYPPEAVAEAILHAAEHRKRDMYVGSQSKLVDYLANMHPKLYDKFAEVYLTRTQHAERPPKSRGNNALYKAGYGLHERGTNVGMVRSRSLYVKASKQPLLYTIAGIGIGTMLLAAAKKRD